MRVITNRPETDEIRFEAPLSARVPFEMERFIHWFNMTASGAPHALAHPPVRAAIAHLYFESIHPFEDGNGRIGRALTGKALAQYVGAPPVVADLGDAQQVPQGLLRCTPNGLVDQ